MAFPNRRRSTSHAQGIAHTLRTRHPPVRAPTPDLSKAVAAVQASVDERGEIVFRPEKKTGGAAQNADPKAKARASVDETVRDRAALPRLKTGIDGMDELLGDGIPRGSIILLSGGAGTGKTIFSLEFLIRGIEEFNEPGIYVSFEEDPESLAKAALLFGWDVHALEQKKMLRIIAKDPYEIRDFAKTMSGEFYNSLRDIGAQRVVFDSITYYGAALGDPQKLRKNIADLCKRLRKLGVTTLFISEVPEDDPASSRSGMEEFVADGVIQLHNISIRDTRQRAIEVRKLRKTNHDLMLHPFKITDSGIQVYSEEQVFKD